MPSAKRELKRDTKVYPAAMKQTINDPYESAECAYFTSHICHSCELLGVSRGSRVESKISRLYETLRRHQISEGLLQSPVLPSHPWQSRRKIKMSVTGTTQAPLLGIVRSDRSSADLQNCCLSPESIRHLLSFLATVITKQNLTPYNIDQRTGELKHIIVMSTADLSQGILRFILRSTELVDRIRKTVAPIQQAYPWIRVVSCNIQPVPAAILEGPEEIILTAGHEIIEQFGEISLFLSPQSFMQVTPEIAAKLYSQARVMVARWKPHSVLDLYCGVGGFSLHVASEAGAVVGVELSESAVASAQRSAGLLGITNTTFHSSDVDLFLHAHQELQPDLVIANPPRRGLSASTIGHLLRMKPKRLLYSSCNPDTFARDAALLGQHFTLEDLTPFDMFPMTMHWEVLGFFSLRKTGTP